jgi:MbtH protein
MNADFDYKVLRNDEDQYSIWPEMKPAPPGWHEVGPVGTREEVLDWVARHWTDMRPASRRGAGADAG